MPIQIANGNGVYGFSVIDPSHTGALLV